MFPIKAHHSKRFLQISLLLAGEPITLLAGDVTGDNQIDIADVVALAARYDTADTRFDLNGDGRVDIIDLVLISGNFNQRGPVR